MIFSAIKYIYNDTEFSLIFKLVEISLALTFITLLSFISIKLQRKSEMAFVFLLVLTSIFSCFVWNLYAKTVPVSDYSVLLEGALKISQGFFSEAFDKTNYFFIYNYQIGYASYLALIIKFMGQNLMFLKCCETIFITLSAIFIYKIASEHINKECGVIASMLFSTFIFNIMGSSIINNQHLSGLLMIMGVYFILKGKYSHTAIAGLIWGIMNVVRPIGIVSIISVFMYFLFLVVTTSHWRRSFSHLLILLFAFYSTLFLFDTVFFNLQIAPRQISKNNLPYFKCVIGLGATNGSLFGNRTKNARKTNVYFDLEKLGFDYLKYNNESLKFLKSKLMDYPNTIKFLKEKMVYFMGEKDHQYTFALDSVKLTDKKIKILASFAHIQYFILLCLAFLSVAIFKRSLPANFVLVLILIANFLAVHLLIEAQTRYRYDIYMLIIILASIPTYHFIHSFEKLNSNK